jgi:hypothetical protein
VVVRPGPVLSPLVVTQLDTQSICDVEQRIDVTGRLMADGHHGGQTMCSARVRWLVLVLVMASASALAACTKSASGSRPDARAPVPTTSGRSTPPSSLAVSPLPGMSEAFVAEYAYGSGDTGGGRGTFLGLFDLRTGRHQANVAHVPDGGLTQLAGYARGPDGDLWYAFAHGPRYSNIPNGTPAPGSCGGTVYRVDHRTGAPGSVFTVSADATVRDPVPSPDGRSIAYLSQPCTSAYSTAVVVRSLTSQREHRIGAVDGWAWHPGWSPDSRQIIFTVRFSVYRGPADRAAFAVVPSDASTQIPRAALKHAPTPNCSVLQATFDAAGLALLEGCPDDLGAGWLTQLDPTRQHSLWRTRTRLCPNGATIVANRPGTDLLLTATTHCGGNDPIVDVVQTWPGPQPHEVGRYTNGQQFVFAAAW